MCIRDSIGIVGRGGPAHGNGDEARCPLAVGGHLAGERRRKLVEGALEGVEGWRAGRESGAVGRGSAGGPVSYTHLRGSRWDALRAEARAE